jgi:signal transduction histidine kinase
MEEKKNSKLSLSQMTMSHEFRAPLSSMLMILQRLLLGMIDAESRKLILVIISQLNLLVCLVNDILDHKLIEQGKFR